jgi:CubicO group peptidase (beta-lactamase class C family)
VPHMELSMVILKKLVVFLLISFLIPSVYASNPSMGRQAYFIKWVKQNEIIGAALAIDNKMYYYGYSDKNLAKPVTETTQFGIGSLTKTFISVILLRLEAEGKLNIHHSIIKYLPQYPKLHSVTIQDLMQMTAGFNDVADESFSPLQQVEMAYKKFNPKLVRHWFYSNVSYQILGLLIEKVTQKPLNKVLFKLITSPLHLNSIYIPDQSQGLSLKEYKNGIVRTSNYNNLYAAGGIVSNIKDLALFVRHLFIIKDLLPPQQYKELTTFVKTSEKYYAFTGIKAPKFGLGVFKWNIPFYGNVIMYAGVLSGGFTSAYTVIGNNIIICQSNTYNHNDFTLLWANRAFTKNLMKSLQ